MNLDAGQLRARAERARERLEDEITKSSATVQQKAFLRQRLSQLWAAVKTLGGFDV